MATGVDQNGEYNSTIKQWTDNILPVGDKTYRVDEASNDITITESSATPRPQNVVGDDVRQTFTVKYRKPFEATNVQDVSIQVLKQFNLTSYYGCYQDTDTAEFGVDPSILYQQEQVTNPDDPEGDLIPGDFIGCQGKWQGDVNGNIQYTNYVTGLGSSFVASETTGPVEAQVTVLVLEGAQKLALALSSMALVMLAY